MEREQRKRSRSPEQSVEDTVMASCRRYIETNPNLPDSYRRVFKCKDCDKEYDTFQALGGHRASHKKVNEDGSSLPSPKLHECRICGAEFAVGQALGGHMRRHQGVKLENGNEFMPEEEVSEEIKNHSVQNHAINQNHGINFGRGEVLAGELGPSTSWHNHNHNHNPTDRMIQLSPQDSEGGGGKKDELILTLMSRHQGEKMLIDSMVKVENRPVVVSIRAKEGLIMPPMRELSRQESATGDMINDLTQESEEEYRERMTIKFL